MTDTVAKVRIDLTTETTNRQTADTALNARVDVLRTDVDVLKARVTQLENSNAVVAALDRVVAAVKTITINVGTGSEPGTGNTGNTGGTTPPAVNAYPVLTMADAITPVVTGIFPTTPPGEIELGSGSDVISMQVGGGFGSLTYLGLPQTPIVFDIWITDELGRHRIAHNVTCSGWGWQGGFANMQRVTFNGTWGKITQMDIVSSGAGYGDYTSFIFPSYNGKSMYAGHDQLFWAGGSGSSNQPATFYTTNPAPVVAGQGGGTVIPEATPTIVTGAVLNGAVVAADTLVNIMKTVTDGFVLELPSGTIIGTTTVPASGTVRGKGIGLTTIDCTGLTPTFQKGVFVPLVPGVVLEDMTITGSAVGDLNGAAIRDEPYNNVGAGFTANRVRFTKNQEGILTFGGQYILNDCEFDHNGSGDGQSHNFYFGGQHVPTSYVELNDVKSHNPLGGHPFKARTAKGRVFGGVYSHGDPNDLGAGGNDAAILNIPVGGDYVFAASKKDGSPTRLIIDTDKDANRNILQYGVDYQNDADDTNVNALGNGLVGKTIDLGPTVIETIGLTPGRFQGPVWATVVLTNVKYKGVKPDFSEWRGTIVGDMTPII